MRFAQAVIVLCSAAVAVAGQDDRLPVLRPDVEIVKASPAPLPLADKKASDYDTWIRTPWVQMNRAKCGGQCVQVSLITKAGPVRIDTSGAKNGPAKLRLALTIPASCAEYAWYGEMKDEMGSAAGVADPAINPIDLARIHMFRFDERGREISMVFQNEHPERARQARLNVLCRTK